MSEAPPFWFRPRGALAHALSPLGRVYGGVVARRMGRPPTARVDATIVCVGNLVVGGAGKTPTAIALAELARSRGRRPGFLSRGYGGSARVPTLVTSDLTARTVGDEPLMLAERHPTIVSPDRPAGAEALVSEGVDLVVMDDGFQNPSLHKDLSLLVVDARRGLGNGLVMPAGPLRAPLAAQVRRADALVVIGRGPDARPAIRAAARRALPILRADIAVRNAEAVRGERVIAFAGIGDPEKFFATLDHAGAEVVERRPFPDHHAFRDEDAAELLDVAARERALLVTTEKDAARMRHARGRVGELSERVTVLSVAVTFEDEARALRLLDKAIDRARRRGSGRQTLASGR